MWHPVQEIGGLIRALVQITKASYRWEPADASVWSLHLKCHSTHLAGRTHVKHIYMIMSVPKVSVCLPLASNTAQKKTIVAIARVFGFIDTSTLPPKSL